MQSETKFKAIKYFFFLTIIRALTFELHVATCTDLHVGTKVVLKYPPYSGLESESFQTIEGKTLGDYVVVGETKLRSLLGIEDEDGVGLSVNEIEVDRGELSRPISEFKVAENEDIQVEFRLKEELNSQNKGGVNNVQEEREGLLILGFSSVDEDVTGQPARVPGAVTVRQRLPMSFGELRKIIEGFTVPGEFSVESVTVQRSPERELVAEMWDREEEVADLVNGDLIRVKVRDLGASGKEVRDEDPWRIDPAEPEAERQEGLLPVMVIFSNRREVPSKLVNLSDNSKVGDLLEILYEMTFPGTEKTVISRASPISIQNEHGREVKQSVEARLRDFVPEEVVISKGRPFVLYVTVLSALEESNEGLSEIFEPKDEKELEEFMLNEAKRLSSDLEAIQDKRRGSDAPIVRLVSREGRVEYEVRGDSSLITVASLYSLAQLVWGSKGHKERNCLLVFENKDGEGKDAIIDPNNHETVSTLPRYRQGARVTMKELRTVKVEILVYLGTRKEQEGLRIDDKILFTKSVEVPEIVSVIDFLRLVYASYGGELSKYVVVGVQRDVGSEQLVEYLPIPRTPSSITYLTFYGEKEQVSIFIEVIPTRNIEIMLMIPSGFIGEQIFQDSGESSDSSEEYLEYRLKILSNTTIRELIESLIERKVLDKSISPSTVYVKDKATGTYLSDGYVIGHHSSEGQVWTKRKTCRTMVFVVEVLKRFYLSAIFYNVQGEELPIQSFQVSVKSGQNVQKLKKDIISKAEKQGALVEEQKVGIGSGLDIGKDFKKVVYTLLKDSDKVRDGGLLPNDELRVYVLGESQDQVRSRESPDTGGGQRETEKVEDARIGQGPKLEIPLAIENCPLNTTLEKRWFIVTMDLGLPIGELKEMVVNIAMLKGVDFDLFGETERGRIELSEESESCSSLGITELGHLTAVCNGKMSDRGGGKKKELEKSLSQAIIDDICEDNRSSEKCSRPTGEVLDKLSSLSKKEADAVFEESSTNESSEEEIKEREEKNKESMKLLEMIESRIRELEEKELRSKKNRKMMDKLLKKEAVASSRGDLKQRELAKLLREFLTVYVSKGPAGLNRFCRKQGSERIEQLVMFISTNEGRNMSIKIAKRILEKERRRGVRSRINHQGLLLDIEYSVIPRIAQYSENEDGSSSSEGSTGESSSDSSQSEEEEGEGNTSTQRLKGEEGRRRRALSKSKVGGGLNKRYLNGDLDPVTKLKRKGKKKNRVIRALSKVPLLSPTISFLYSRLTSKGRKKRRAKKYVKEILELEIQFRRSAYGHFQDLDQSQEGGGGGDYLADLMRY